MCEGNRGDLVCKSQGQQDSTEAQWRKLLLELAIVTFLIRQTFSGCGVSSLCVVGLSSVRSLRY